MANEARTKRARSQGGFSLLDTLIGSVILAIALLGHVASTIAEDAMARDGQTRSEALHVVRQFTERMRADDDWAGLYARLQQAQTLAGMSTVPADTASDPVRLPDGRWAFKPSFYYPDLVESERVPSVRLLVEVPMAGDGLREDQADARFGLPADLNGDGTVDDQPHQTDYRVLPVRFRFTWSADGLGQRECTVTAWLGLIR